ncbi:MAG: hypothetical protein A2021_00535 [Elusimicrobia bacterium GWF2_52_66]|nr:MAG: hypothetical protein A2X33_06170 [Elusimicrobia bacterium GWA2_51_34]OGR85215.1 MAG: hypothetical protein A2021_00535 [Elusimicrobia bacterium GWF2_52_66]HAF94745.1 hypothetical protein [Elusimicrobiota bacterium]HCE97645.1 hypothetical protein [Elusimicrobiota bacterium]
MMDNSGGGFWSLALAMLLAFAFNLSAPAAGPQSGSYGVSRPMEQAMRLYHEGQDNEAMDRFMDILTRGTPSERSLANEYVTKITLRMNTGLDTPKDKGSDAGALSDVEEVRKEPGKRQTPSQERERVSDSEEAEMAAADAKVSRKEMVSEKIAAKIAEMRRSILLELGRSDAVKIYMGDSLPKAITINTSAFFAREAVFKPGVTPLLSGLAGLMFTMGKADCLILPEGSARNDVKIKSIRQALALNSYLISRGISPARIEVNLTGSDVKLPKELTNIGGLIMIFSYDNAPRLKEREDFPTKGPRISLGIYPTALSMRADEGAIVEFSVFEPPTGTPSWKFQIFEVRKDNNILLLQAISGIGAQYNQSFWNGRKNFFGAPYPSGKYMFSLTAADVEGKETTVQRTLVIRPTPEEEKASRAGLLSAAAVKAKELKSRAETKAGTSGKPPLKTGKALLKKGSSARKPALFTAGKYGQKKKTGLSPAKNKRAAAPQTNPDEAASVADSARGPRQASVTVADSPPKAEQDRVIAQATGDGENQIPFSGQVSYKIYFKENSATITANSEKKLSQVAETLNYYPISTVKLTGYAYSGEPNAEAMAENRVNYVVARLSKKYKIDKNRLDAQTKVSETPKTLVEIKLAGQE